MANFVYIATSLDGFIAGEDGDSSWLTEIPNPDQSDFGFADFMSRIDALIMGRKTFDQVLAFGVWPYDKPVFVLSNTLRSIPAEAATKAEVINGELEPVIAKLKSRGHLNLYVDGGVTIQSFLQEDLIDEMIITRVPILLGSGVQLFGHLQDAMEFSLERTEILNGGLVKSSYKRVRSEGLSSRDHSTHA